jgi:hypothetical protein
MLLKTINFNKGLFFTKNSVKFGKQNPVKMSYKQFRNTTAQQNMVVLFTCLKSKPNMHLE